MTYTKDIIVETTNEMKKQYDQACKKLLSDSQLLARIIKYTVKEVQEYSLIEIESFIRNVTVDEVNVHPGRRIHTLNNEIAFKDEGKSNFDVYFYIDIPQGKQIEVNLRLYINIEAQNEYNPKYEIVTRGIAYCARMISQQFETEMYDNAYERMKKVYSIWIIPWSAKKLDGTMRSYSIEERIISGEPLEDKTSYDKIAVGTIYLGKNHKVEERYEEMDELMTPLTVLFTNNINDANEKIRILDDEYGIKLTEESKEEVKDMCNLSEGIEMDALDRGIVIGEKRGKKEGIREGKIEAIIELVKDGDLTIEKAIRKLGITKDDFELLMSE